MTVKTIFKVLLASIVIPVVGSLLIEFYNISSVSADIGRMTHAAASQAANLFTQETYKVAGSGSNTNGLGNQKNVIGANGEIFVSGKFYSGRTADEIYRQLYTGSSFKNWIKSDLIKNKAKWNSLKIIDSKLNNRNSGLNEDEKALATVYVNTLMTPSNLGVPYLDKDIVESMFKWNMAEMFSSGKAANIKKDSSGRMYASFNGYKVYADQARITSLEYRIYDLGVSADRIAFEGITNVNPRRLGGSGTFGSADERRRVAIVGINYTVPTGYEGVTPLKRIFEFVWSTEVNGLDGKSQRQTEGTRWNEATAEYKSGGFRGNTDPAVQGILPVPGKLVFYIIR